MTPYVVSKWGVRALARQLHIENLEAQVSQLRAQTQGLAAEALRQQARAAAAC